MQTIDQQKALPLHDYDKLSERPKRAALTRFGHTLDITDGALVITTKGGYSVTLEDSETKQGKVVVKGPSNHQVIVDDTEKTVTLQTNSGQLIQLDDLGNSITLMSNETLELQTGEELSAQAGQIKLEALGEGVTIQGFSQIKLTVGGRSLTVSPTGFSFT